MYSIIIFTIKTESLLGCVRAFSHKIKKARLYEEVFDRLFSFNIVNVVERLS